MKKTESQSALGGYEGRRPFRFEREGVIVNIPSQSDGKVIIPHQLDFAWIPEMRLIPEFSPNRLVINVEFVDENDPEVPLESFDPPLEFQVYYTLGDESFASKDGRPIAIAYWKDEQWKFIDEANHGLTNIFPIFSPGWTGVLRFFIQEWGEPTIALG